MRGPFQVVVVMAALAGCQELKISSSVPEPGEVGLDTDGLGVDPELGLTPPIARCRFDPRSLVLPGEISLLGNDSSDEDGLPLTASWSFSTVPAGSIVEMPDLDTLDIGPITLDLPGVYAARLVVTNSAGVSSQPCTTTLQATAPPPVAVCDADPRNPIAGAESVTLLGRDSYDPLARPLTGAWRLLSAPTTAPLSIPGIDELDREPVWLDQSGLYTFELTVTNDRGVASEPCTVEVDAQASDCEVPLEPFDATCERTPSPADLQHEVQCAWRQPPLGDPRPDAIQVMSTPVVVDFDFDLDASTLRPSIVFTSFAGAAYQSNGVIRVIDGGACDHQYTLAEPTIIGAAPPALADLDLDGRAEIIAARGDGGLAAWRYDVASDRFVSLWSSALCGTVRTPDSTGGSNKWTGPSVHDLDDDGVPEIIYGRTVYDANGCILSDRLGFPTDINVGSIPVLTDADDDGDMELLQADGIWSWDAGLGDWVAEPGFSTTYSGAGRIAVADMGSWPLVDRGNRDLAEVVVVSGGQARVQTQDGTVVFGPFGIPGGGGGPPTAADFDGDGRLEFGVAGRDAYAIFDLDCVSGGDPAGCGGQFRTDGLLWTQESQDFSSQQTGSSVFDFNGDGAAEAIYGDECYLRLYDGSTGDVILSVPRSSGTTLENPVIVDSDGDLAAEIVTSVNDYNSRSCPGTDPLFPSASFTPDHGIQVLSHPEDAWVVTRPVWNQHAYSVTNVDDHGGIPATSDYRPNWMDPDLNNFRQNSPGSLPLLGIADLSVGCSSPTLVDCDGAVMHLPVEVCNQGSLAAQPGAEVAVRDGSQAGPEVCRAVLQSPLDPGSCVTLQCSGSATSTELHLLADPDGVRDECVEDNNEGVLLDVVCR